MTEEEKRVAQDPSTPSDVLETLGKEWLTKWRRGFQRGTHIGPFIGDGHYYHHIEEVEQAVAANPNTPPHVLVELACHFPDAFARNPVAPLLPLECPDLIAALPDRKKWWAVWHEKTPASFLLALHATTSDPEMRETIDAHIAIAGEVLPETLPAELRALLIRDARRLRGKNRKALQTLIQGGVVPAWLLKNRQKGEVNSLQTTERDDTAKEELAQQVMYEIYDDAPPVIVFLFLSSPYTVGYEHKHIRSRWGALGWMFNPEVDQCGVALKYKRYADRYIRAAAHARLRGEEVTLW